MNIGRYGEKLGVDYLEKKGYIILKRNYYTRIGEIDIIAEQKNTLVFIEVKTRIGTQSGEPYEAITAKKLYTIRSVARLYLQTAKSAYAHLRVDVISIVLDNFLQVASLNHFENAYL
ncbi:MAG: hypothetical protein UZ22_OP11002000230 [Microgenomates bacterium OLB23]|nr:MAG: hypothetical protein UZ22_OP11002000230 [Microgenomates bacterium OLB23]